MSDNPLFANLIVSRPRPVVRALNRARALAVALSLHATAAAVLLLAPLVLLEAMHPIDARPPDRIPIFQPKTPGPDTRGDRLPVPRVRQGGRSAARRPEALPAPASNPIPDQDADPTDIDADQRSLGSMHGPGDPDGQGTGERGSPFGCDSCIGGGPGGPGDDHDSSTGPYQPGDPRITHPIIIPSSRALPRYPDLARRAGLEGTVILTIVIGPDGRVGEIEVLRSPDQRWGFDLAAIEAVKQWRYQPALMAGRPVAVYAQVMVEFTISR